MRQHYPEFLHRNAEVIAICPEGPEKVREYWQKEALPFIGLADPEHAVAKLYGQEVSLLKLGRMPAIVIVGRDGHICYRHFAGGMSDIPPVSDLLSILDQRNRSETGESP